MCEAAVRVVGREGREDTWLFGAETKDSEPVLPLVLIVDTRETTLSPTF